jgi:hypothetical protein
MADWLALALVLLAGIGVGLALGHRLFAPREGLHRPAPRPNRPMTPGELAKALKDNPKLGVRIVRRDDQC